MVEDVVHAFPLQCSIIMAKAAAARDVEESSQDASSDEEELEIDGVVAGTGGDGTSAEEEAEPGSEDEADEGSDAETKPRAKAKAKGRQKVLGAKAGSGGKAKAERNTKDLKFCSGCGKSHDKSEFQAGNSKCFLAARGIRNLRVLAKSQQKTEWFDEVMIDQKKLQRVLKGYWNRVPSVDGERRKKMHCKGEKALFSFVQYIEEERRAEQLLRDGVWEMMDERCFQAWMLKPKNGSIEAAAASQKFQDLVADPTSITDMLGSCPRYAQRVAVKKKDMITFRDLTEHAQITRAAEAEKQKATQADLDASLAKLDHGAQFGGSAVRDRLDIAKRMNAARSASATSDMPMAPFSDLGTAAMALPDVMDLDDVAPEQSPRLSRPRRGAWEPRVNLGSTKPTR